MLALEGVNILDLCRGYPGSWGTWILGDLGAEVINIDPPPAVQALVSVEERSLEEEQRRAVWEPANRNKKSIRLNLRTEEGRNIFYRLTETADVIVEEFRPGVTKRLGIDYETIAGINPKIVYCSLSGYGQDGPYQDLPGHDNNYISMAGILSLIGNRQGKPVTPPIAVADFIASLNGTIGVLTSLIAREKTGKGQHIDISFTDGAISLMGLLYGREYFQNGTVPKRGELLSNYPYCDTYETKDRKFISIGCIEPWLWENLCRAIGKEDFIPLHFQPEHFYQPPKDKKWEEVSSYLENLFRIRTRDEWFDFLGQKGIPVGKLYALDEVFADPQVVHRKMVMEIEHPAQGKVKQVGIAIKLSDTPGKVRSLSPVLGEHTEEVLKGLGYDKGEIAKLREEGIIR